LVHFAFSGIIIVTISANVVIVTLCLFLLKRMRILKHSIESVIWREKRTCDLSGLLPASAALSPIASSPP